MANELTQQELSALRVEAENIFLDSAALLPEDASNERREIWNRVKWSFVDGYLAHAQRQATEQGQVEWVKKAAMACARHAWGYWRGDSTGQGSALAYFDDGLGEDRRQSFAATYEGIIRHFLAAASHKGKGEGVKPLQVTHQDVTALLKAHIVRQESES